MISLESILRLIKNLQIQALLKKLYQGVGETVEAGEVGSCAMGRSGVVGEFDSDIEEGIPYITGIFSIIFLFKSLLSRNG
jgi:hypothetical protein